jgi:hypothetical protein
MIKMKSAGSPTLTATKAQFPFFMDEFASIKRDVLERLITNTATGGAAAIPMTDTTGFAVGQNITIRDTAASENCIITVVTAGVSLTVAVNLTNTYTVARGGIVTVRDVTLPITGTATGGAAVVPMTNTTGMQAGQLLVIEDSAGAETGIVNVVTPGVQITVTVNLSNTYTVARGGRVTIVNGNAARASVSMQKPFAAAAGNAEWIDCSFAVGVIAVVVTVNKADAGAGPALPIAWAAAVTADVIAQNFVCIADGE